VVRVSEEKIRFLADRVARWLAAQEGVQAAAPEILAPEVARVFREDFRREDALDVDVEKVMSRYRRQIESEKADLNLLRQKIKRQLAKERGLVL
jgi:hypothetical protein